jgi:hypothetical protein
LETPGTDTEGLLAINIPRVMSEILVNFILAVRTSCEIRIYALSETLKLVLVSSPLLESSTMFELN